MLIRCPACEHARNINTDKIPPRAEFATCPKCGHRFRFRALALDDDPEPAAPAADTRHKDIWDAVDSLQERWQGKTDSDDAPKEREKPATRAHDDEEEKSDDRPIRDLGRLEEGQPWSERDAADAEEGYPDPVAIPWEQPKELGYFASFYHTMLLALLSPARFYSSLTPSLPLTPALFFYILFGVFQYIFDTVWLQAAIRMAGPETLANLPQTMVQATDVSRIPMALLMSPFLLALYLLLTVWLVHLCMRLVAPGRAHFAVTFKIASYAASALVLTAIPFLGPALGPVGYFVCLLMGCRYAYALSWGKAFFGLVPLAVLVLLMAAAQYMPAP